MFRLLQVRYIHEYNGPKHAYASMIKAGRLKTDPSQEQTVELLHNLYEKLLKHKEPPITSLGIKGIQLLQNKKETLDSPDFAWIKNEQKTFLRQVSDYFSNIKTANTRLNLNQNGLKGIYMYGSVGTGKTMLSMFNN
jgi:predicted ATPase